MNRRIILMLSLLTAGLLAGTPSLALANITDARRAAQLAENLVAGNNFNSALQSLDSVNCDKNNQCQVLVYFTKGWAYESWSNQPSKQSTARLKRAQNYYRRAARLAPENSKVLSNLALVAHRLGDYRTAANAISDVIKLRPDDAYNNYLFLAEIYQAEGQHKKARKAYEAAIKINPKDALGHQHLIEFFRNSAAGPDLFKYSLKLRTEFPALAATGFEYAIKLLYQSDPHQAEQALARWTAIRSDLGSLTSANLKQLPGRQWKSSGLRQLTLITRSNKKPPSTNAISWWLKNPVRKDALSRLLRHRATRLITKAENVETGKQQRIDAQHSAIAYLTAAVELAPKYYSYLDRSLAGSSNARLDAATDLLALHHSLKTADAPEDLSIVSENELSEMTNILFSGKGGAYAAGQLHDIQRFHTVLGMIYYETGRDQSSGADNATFQLEHALKTAKKIARRNPEQYQPLPELNTLLSEVYQRQGKTTESARESLTATMGYLEKDNLPQANKALQRAKILGAKKQKTSALSTILQGRQAVQASGAALVKSQPGDEKLKLDAKLNWLVDSSALKLPRKFVEAQRFKTLADLGNRLPKTLNKSTASSINRLTLDAARKNRVLTSPTDIKRIQQLETRIKAAPVETLKIKPAQVKGTPKTSVNIKKAPAWTLPSKQGSLKIQIDPRVIKKQPELKQLNRDKLKLSPVISQ